MPRIRRTEGSARIRGRGFFQNMEWVEVDVDFANGLRGDTRWEIEGENIIETKKMVDESPSILSEDLIEVAEEPVVEKKKKKKTFGTLSRG